MDERSKSVTVLRNFLWRLAERSAAQIVGLVVSIILARLLTPEDYGTVALLTVFTGILGVFVDCGFSAALVQKEDADDTDFSTIFAFNLCSCIFLYIGLYASAPVIAAFYGRAELVAMTRVLGITLVVSGLRSVQGAYVSRNMLFRRFFFSTLGGTVCSAVVGVIMAYAGFGPWAIVAQSLTNTVVDTAILWVTVRWRPKWSFSLSRLREMFSYSWKLLASALLDTGYNNLRSLVIGKAYTAEDLAYYNRGQSWPYVVVANVNSSIDSVLFPAMSSVQGDPERVKSMTRRALQISTYVMAPLMLGIAVCGEPLVRLVLTEKWLPCVPFQTVFCITYIFWPVHTANLNAIKAMGRSDLFLRLEVIKKGVGLAVMAVSVPMGVMAMCYSLLFTTVMSQIINSWPNKRLLGYGYIEQLRDILPGILLAAAMALAIHPIKYLGMSDAVTLLLMGIMGATFYVVGSRILNIRAFDYLWSMIKQRMPKRYES